MKAVFHTCRAMHTSLSGKADGQQSSFCHCERASGHLWSSLNVSGATCDLTLNHVSGGRSGPSGRCPAAVGGNTPTLPSPRRRPLAQLGSLVVLGVSEFVPELLLGSPSPGACWSSALPAPGEPGSPRAPHLLQAVRTTPPDGRRPALEERGPQPHAHPQPTDHLCTSKARCTPPSGQLWCIVVALHVLAVPVQCFHSASQRPAWPSRDFSPVPWQRALPPL